MAWSRTRMMQRHVPVVIMLHIPFKPRSNCALNGSKSHSCLCIINFNGRIIMPYLAIPKEENPFPY